MVKNSIKIFQELLSLMETSSDRIDQQDNLNKEYEKSIEERFIELSTNTPIEYLDNHETVINGLLISIKNAILSFTMVMTMSFSTILNNLINTDFGKSIVEKAINRILMYERGIYRIKEQFDTNLNCPPFNTESFRPTIDTIIKIHDTKLKEYVDKLEDKTD